MVVSSRFVLEFVPGCTEEELRGQGSRFVSNANTWGRGGISIGMVKQFLMKRISIFRGAELSKDRLEPGAAFTVPPQLRKQFFDQLCENEPAIAHLESYPLVAEWDENSNQHQEEPLRKKNRRGD